MAGHSSRMPRTTLHADRTGTGPGRGADDGPSIDGTGALAALDDPDCRAILEAATEEPRTAGELIERCDLPRSTTYRKVDRLVDAGLLEERVRIRRDGAHASEYRRAVEDVVVSIDADGDVELAVERPARDPQ